MILHIKGPVVLNSGHQQSFAFRPRQGMMGMVQIHSTEVGAMMPRFRSLAATACAAMIVFGMAISPQPAAAQAPICSYSNTTINGGLDVTTGEHCVLTNVTVNGGAKVEYAASLELENSTINNGLTVYPGGSLFADYELPNTIQDLSPSTINGFLTVNSMLYVSDVVLPNIILFNIKVNGPTTINGMDDYDPYVVAICGGTFNGPVQLNNLSSDGDVIFGDPSGTGELGAGGESYLNGRCPGNTVNGSLTVTNPERLEVESNSIRGALTVTVDPGPSYVDVAGNTVYLNADCTNLASVRPYDSDHATHNKVFGTNHGCP